MHDHTSDPRVTSFGSDGYSVTTSQGTYRVLNSGDVLGWGVYQGTGLDLAVTDDGRPIIGAVGPNELIAALLQADDDTDGAGQDTNYAQGVRDGAAAHRHEISGYDEQLFTDPDYHKGLQDGRTAAIDQELADHDTAADHSMTNYYDHYRNNPQALAEACDRGAADLRREAAEALQAGDQSRHDRKLRAAEFTDDYAQTVRDGTANLDHAQIVAHAANMSGILVDGPMPDTESRWNPEGLRAEQEFVAKRKAELQSAAAAGLVSRVDDPGQVAFYALPGYEPDGYDPQTHTTDLRDRTADSTDQDTAAQAEVQDPHENEDHHTSRNEPEESTMNHTDGHDRLESGIYDTVNADSVQFGSAGPGRSYVPGSEDTSGGMTVTIGTVNAAHVSYGDGSEAVGTYQQPADEDGWE